MLMFREEKSPEDEIKAWQFWHGRQHSVKQRILDAGNVLEMYPAINVGNYSCVGRIDIFCSLRASVWGFVYNSCIRFTKFKTINSIGKNSQKCL